MRNLILFLLVVSTGTKSGQASDASVTFEAASIKVAPQSGYVPGKMVGCTGGPGSKDPSLIICNDVGTAMLVHIAYGIPIFRIAGLRATDGPFFELAIRVPRGASADRAGMMWQNLLADRFKLQVHREQREMAGYVLGIARGGPKMKRPVVRSPENSESGEPQSFASLKRNKDGLVPEEQVWAWAASHPGQMLMSMPGTSRVVFSNADIADLTEMVQRRLQKPVVDATGLKGKYDFRLWWSAAAWVDSDDPAGPRSLFAALKEQLGLKLDARQVKVEVLVVDHAERLPTEN